MLRICGCDDEPAALERLQLFLEKFFEESGQSCSFSTFRSGEQLLECYSPVYDIIFLDVMMSGTNGLETARQIRLLDEDVVIIFLTQTIKYAVKGYEVNAFDYIVKPIDYPSFKLKMKRAIKVVQMTVKEKLQKIELSTETQSILVATRDIYYVEILGHYLTYHTSLGDYTVRGTLAEAAKQLSDKGFLPCSRFCLVNLRHITRISKESLTVAGSELEISRRQYKPLMEGLVIFRAGGGIGNA